MNDQLKSVFSHQPERPDISSSWNGLWSIAWLLVFLLCPKEGRAWSVLTNDQMVDPDAAVVIPGSDQRPTSWTKPDYTKEHWTDFDTNLPPTGTSQLYHPSFKE